MFIINQDKPTCLNWKCHLDYLKNKLLKCCILVYCIHQS